MFIMKLPFFVVFSFLKECKAPVTYNRLVEWGEEKSYLHRPPVASSDFEGHSFMWILGYQIAFAGLE